LSINEKYKISKESSIREAVKIMDVNSIDSLMVMSNEKVVAVFTMGDFRRAVLDGLDINNCLSSIVNEEFKFLKEDYSQEELISIFKFNQLVNDVPVIDDSGCLLSIVSRKSHYSSVEILQEGKKLQDICVVIMAGGKGKRMDPFTRILPKPLIPIGNQPIIQKIMDEFQAYGLEHFFISINDKGQMVKAYFHDHDLPYSIQYIEENKPLGTAGALRKMSDVTTEPIIVSNCDILIRANYLSILDHHIKGKYKMTLIASMRQYVIPYGVCEVDQGGELKQINEKPEYDYLINTGMYILDPSILNLIPEDEYFDITDLINMLIKNNYSVGVYPVSENSWKDIGQWKEYKKTITELE